MRLVLRNLLSLLVVVILLLPVGAAAEDELVAPWITPEDVGAEENVTVDGRLDEPYWTEAGHQQLRAGADDEERFAHVYTFHNGTHVFVGLYVDARDEGPVTLMFDAAHREDDSGGSLDALRLDGGNIDDLDFEGEDEAWVSDSEQEGCSIDGEAAASAYGEAWTYEFAKPIDADDGCDMFAPAGQTIGFRITFGMDPEFVWPAASEDTNLDESLADWGELTLHDAFGEEDRDVPSAPRGDSGQPDLETGERPGLDPNQQAPAGAVDQEAPAYDANERGTPGPGWVLFLAVGVGSLALVAVLRRR